MAQHGPLSRNVRKSLKPQQRWACYLGVRDLKAFGFTHRALATADMWEANDRGNEIIEGGEENRSSEEDEEHDYVEIGEGKEGGCFNPQHIPWWRVPARSVVRRMRARL